MTKAQLKKIKELDVFLKQRKMKLRGSDIIMGFNMHKYGTEKHVQLNLDIGYIRGSDSNIEELNEIPKIKEHYHIDKNGKLKSY